MTHPNQVFFQISCSSGEKTLTKSLEYNPSWNAALTASPCVAHVWTDL
jgi:hypothetical protein